MKNNYLVNLKDFQFFDVFQGVKKELLQEY